MSLDGDWVRFGKLAAERRDKLGLTQKEAADRSGHGISVQTWRAIENAYNPPFRRSGLEAMCRVLGWSTRSIDRILAGGHPIIGVDDEEPFDVHAKLAQAQAILDEIASHYRATSS